MRQRKPFTAATTFYADGPIDSPVAAEGGRI